MCSGSDSARKTLKQGETVKAKPSSTEVEDELASMRGTKDMDRIAYVERKQIRGICNAEEDPRIASHSATSLSKASHSATSLSKEVSSETSPSRHSRESSPAKSSLLSKRHGVKSASDKGCFISVVCTHTQLPKVFLFFTLIQSFSSRKTF